MNKHRALGINPQDTAFKPEINVQFASCEAQC